MRMRFALTGLLTSVVNLLLHALVYFLWLKQFFEAHPAGTLEFRRQLVKDADEMVLWALALSGLAFGYLITTVVKWSGARGWRSGMRTGAIVGTLLWAGVNFGFYASSYNFSLPGTLADLVCSALCVTLSAGFAAWLLHARRGAREEGMGGDMATPGVRPR
jgi:Na+/proline symporter